MNDDIRKVFDMLGVEPNEEFKVIAGDESNITYKFKFDENSRTYLRKELGLEGYQVIGHAGRMDKGKNQLF